VSPTSHDRRAMISAFWTRTERYRSYGWDRFAAADSVAGWLDPSSRRVLDIGTGQGLLAAALARRGFGVLSGDVSLDTHPVATELVRVFSVADRVHYLLCDGSSLPFSDASFDRITMMNVLHHLGHLRPVLTELTRVAMPGCQLVLADFSKAGFELVSQVHREGGGKHSSTGVTLEAAEARLTAAGWNLRRRGTQHLEEVASFQYGRADRRRPR